jgi:hypothetical protein
LQERAQHRALAELIEGLVQTLQVRLLHDRGPGRDPQQRPRLAERAARRVDGLAEDGGERVEVQLIVER